MPKIKSIKAPHTLNLRQKNMKTPQSVQCIFRFILISPFLGLSWGALLPHLCIFWFILGFLSLMSYFSGICLSLFPWCFSSGCSPSFTAPVSASSLHLLTVSVGEDFFFSFHKKYKVPLFPINKQDRALDQSEPESEVEIFCNKPITIGRWLHEPVGSGGHCIETFNIKWSY